jgi:CheY-like chemotaxis protein
VTSDANVSAEVPLPPLSEHLSPAEMPLLLVVEDNSDLRQYIGTQFEHRYQVVEATNGQEGLEKAIDLIPDLVICDLMMPRLDGFGFCKALKSDLRTSHIPVIMLTAKASLEDRLEGLELGADDYLAKPFNTEELQIRVRNLILIREKIRNQYATVAVPPKPSPASATLDDKFIQQVREIIEKHLTDNAFDVEALASPLNSSPIQVRRKLKALTGQTAIEFVRNYRLDRAAAMLRSREGNVSEIAYRVGFESLPYFSKAFQDRFGKKPSEW